ncbi:hypothetical protein [Desulfosarcina ovata]|uniref:Uncharacterized protein n=2 Tax=Desulfosarcina ovata TaxID=83564 RepID=A0A5K8AF23_9BACT|nr:hypothetical protein [Desulfosarcina ovata]BBO84056.1 hypothetical protein DSCO28_46220 [Desulfosarcina ovata subsp. sediminis]BBO90530.1 hypothetical protein DSCOOX_37100 [Desulfosarcina ovata subsp. ovata]
MPKRNTPESEAFLPIKDQRELAKVGMVTSMGALLVTGFMGREASRLHIGAGLALIGFSYWHYRLYQPKTPSR